LEVVAELVRGKWFLCFSYRDRCFGTGECLRGSAQQETQDDLRPAFCKFFDDVRL